MDNNDVQYFIQEMIKTKGWDIVKEWLDNKRASYLAQLVRANDIESVRRLQGQITFIDMFLTRIDSWLKGGSTGG